MKNYKIVIIIIPTVLVVIFIIYTNNFKKNEFNYSNIIVNETNQNKIEEVKNNIIKVYVTGEVRTSGVIELKEGDRIEDAVIKAGGLTEKSNLKNINLAYILEDGQKLYIPSIDDKEDIEYIIDEHVYLKSNASKKVNINKATQEQLQTLSGIGPAMAEEIIQYREQDGKFNNIEDIKKVSGIGDKKYEKIKDYIEIK